MADPTRRIEAWKLKSTPERTKQVLEARHEGMPWSYLGSGRLLLSCSLHRWSLSSGAVSRRLTPSPQSGPKFSTSASRSL